MPGSFADRRASLAALLFICATLVPAYDASAQEQNAVAAAGSPAETVIVTGSRIRRQETETPSPLQVITRDDIERTGQSNLGDILRSVSADNQGSIPTAFSAGLAPGAAAISLRGLGVNSTLVLLNGRRMTNYGLADDGTRTFVDLNTLPLAAVERVEVVKDGASAIYGSDAIAGVVNIILRDHYEGVQLGGNWGTSYKRDGDTTRLNLTAGYGDLGTDRYNVFFTAEVGRDQAIAQSKRSGFLGTTNLSSLGFFDGREGSFMMGAGEFGDLSGPAIATYTPYGTVRVPGGTQSERINLTACPQVSAITGVCLFDPINYYQVQPRVDRANLYAHGVYRVTDNSQAYLELGYFHDKTEAIGSPGFSNDSGVFNAADPNNLVVHVSTLPASHPDNPTGVDRTLSLLTTFAGGRDTNISTNVIRAIAGLKGSFTADWTYDLGVGYVKSESTRHQSGNLYYPAWQAALDSGTFRIDPALDSPALIASVAPVLTDKPSTSITMADATVNGDVADLRGGKLGVAVGVEYRKEKAEQPPVPFTDTGDIVGLGYSAYSADRNVAAVYAEVNAPVLSILNIDAAYRYDHYSDYGHSTTPKIGFTFVPIKQLMLRGSYSEGFRAPGPAESGNSSSLGYTNIAIVSRGNPDVRPETSKSYTFGVVLQPLPQSTLSVDYWRIDRKNEILAADQGVIVGGLPVSGTPGSVIPGSVPNSFLYYGDNGDLATISGYFFNATKTVTDGIDLDLRETFQLGQNGGKIEASIIATHTLKYRKEFPDGTELEYVGTHGPYALSSAGGTPRDRGNLEVTWSKNAVSLTGRMNYVSGMKMVDHQGSQLVDNGDGTFSTDTFEGSYFNVNPNGTVCGVYYPDGSVPEGNCKLPSFITFDFYGKVGVGEHLELNLAVDNILNKKTPFDPYTYGGLNYNPTFYQSGAVGLFMTVGATYKF